MSKTDAIRAMKLARLESQRAAAPTAPAAKPAARTAATKPSAATAAPRADVAPAADSSVDLVPEALCGHTAISGRRCTRPQGHAEKNHRYAA